jgi:hypothetical protein
MMIMLLYHKSGGKVNMFLQDDFYNNPSAVMDDNRAIVKAIMQEAFADMAAGNDALPDDRYELMLRIFARTLAAKEQALRAFEANAAMRGCDTICK